MLAWEDGFDGFLFGREENSVQLTRLDHIRDADKRHKPTLENLER